MLAVERRKPSCVEFLVDAGANVNAANKASCGASVHTGGVLWVVCASQKNVTALHLAAQLEDLSTVDLLLLAGAESLVETVVMGSRSFHVAVLCVYMCCLT